MDLMKYCKDSDELITIDEYIHLLKKVLNNKTYTNMSVDKTVFVKKIEKYGIKIDRSKKPFKISKNTMPVLVDKILDGIKIVNPRVINEFHITQAKLGVEDLNRFIIKSETKEILGDNYNNGSVMYKIETEFPYIYIPFIHSTHTFYEKEKLIDFTEKWIDKNVKKKLSEKEKSDQEGELLSVTKVLEISREKLPEIIEKSNMSSKSFGNKVKSLYPEVGCVSDKGFKIFENKIDELIKDIIVDMKIFNIDKEDDMKDFVKYNISKEDLNLELMNKYVGRTYIKEKIDDKPDWVSIEKKIPHIKTDLIPKGAFFRKEVVDFVAHLHSNGVSLKKVLSEINEELNTNFTRTVLKRVIDDEGINTYNFVPGFPPSERVIILKADIDRLKKKLEEKDMYQGCDNLYSRMIQYTKKEFQYKNPKIKKTLEWFDKYVIEVNDETRPKYVTATFRECSLTYEIMNNNLNKELIDYSQDEIVDVFENVSKDYPQYIVDRFRLFFNYLMSKNLKYDRRIYRPNEEGEKILPYDLKSYFSVLGNLINFINDKDNFKKIINTVGARGKACSLLYILTHYTACWRASDIVEQLPKPNLKLIGFDDAEKFMEWLEKEDSVFTEEMGRLICSDIENKIKITRACASKNDGKLLLYISKFLYKIYGVLLCVCEVYRQRSKAENLLIELSPSKMANVVNKLDPEILKSIGKFGNRRANKSFETYISEKSEEWNMGVGYLMASVARGHKLNERHFSETTKIYIDKDIDAISYMVFSSNVFSGVKYEFLSLIDEKFEDGSLREKHIKSVEFGMDNYEIEIMMESISSQRSAINKFFKKYLYTKEKKKATLFELIFGKDCTSKHEDAKCLLRAYLNSENKHEINLSEGFTKPCIYTGANSCIGCPYLIAEKYFLYELELRLMDAIESLENATSDFDKMIHLGRLKELFFPIVFDAVNEFGADYVKEIVSFEKMTSVYKRERDALNLRKKEGEMKVISN